MMYGCANMWMSGFENELHMFKTNKSIQLWYK